METEMLEIMKKFIYTYKDSSEYKTQFKVALICGLFGINIEIQENKRYLNQIKTELKKSLKQISEELKKIIRKI